MCADRKPRQSPRGHPVWRRNGERHEHVEPVVARRRVHVHGRGDRHVGHGHPLRTDGGPEGSERCRAQRFPDIEQGTLPGRRTSGTPVPTPGSRYSLDRGYR